MTDRHILVIDDSAEIAGLFSIAADQAGLTVTHCWNGAEALSILTKSPDSFARIFLDMTMPVMDGRDFLEALARRLPSFRTPIVLMTAAPPPHPLPFVTATLRKPFSFIDLSNALSNTEEHRGAPPA